METKKRMVRKERRMGKKNRRTGRLKRRETKEIVRKERRTE